MPCDKLVPCAKCRAADKDARLTDKDMATACTFTAGSLYCINDLCPNPNHREAPDVN